MKRDLYADVSGRILAELRTGAAPWVKPWSQTPGMNHPHNAATGRPYSGCNVVLLWTTRGRWAAPRFLTFKQALDLGGNVCRGEHGTKVYFVKRLEVRDQADNGSENTRTVPMLREYMLFNVEQCENLPDRVVNPIAKAPRNRDARDAIADEFLAATKADIREGAGEAYYASGADFVSIPAFEAFRSHDQFYSVVFHELGHWTGHKSRLDREFGKRFGDRAYAAEELVAELCSAFLCAEFSIDGDVRHAGYIAHWIELLKADARAFFTAASKAQAAADYMRSLALAEPTAIAA
jgi:antirestriction protein ArdC